ncbi:Transglycosylase SLT domain-containing protein [Alicyclobacillus tolerans]|uniref:Transglycosylase SLT domain-containing protein n=2 Tax=Alicyclobacillus tolerans TaxID=90970 RepID=A0A1M6XAV3_9BACL|nr:Transglycosylase SLT domain-containing protein [Alicyclobacillus montanus]
MSLRTRTTSLVLWCAMFLCLLWLFFPQTQRPTNNGSVREEKTSSILIPELHIANLEWPFQAHLTIKEKGNISIPHSSIYSENSVFFEPKNLVLKRKVMQNAKQILNHPALIRYKVESGDTLWSISTIYHVPIQTIEMDNGLDSTTIYPGQVLLLNHPRLVPLEIPSTLKNVPRNLLPIYMQAAAKYHIPWTILAAIHKTETDFSTAGFIESYAGAIGPMQFMPATFAEFGVTAPGQTGAPNIHNVEDAIYSTAHMLSVCGFDHNPWQAIWDYNHSTYYVDHVLTLANF